MTEHKLSLAKFYRILFVLFLITLFLSVGVLYRIRTNLKQQVESTFTSRIQSQIHMLENTNQGMEKAMANLLVDNEKVALLQEDPDIYTHDLTVRNLKIELKTLRDYFSSSYNFFCYDGSNDEFMMPRPLTTDLATAATINAVIVNYVHENQETLIPSNNKWMLLATADGTVFVTKIYHSDDMYVGCWSTVDYLSERFGVNEYSSVNESLFLVKNSEIQTGLSEYEALFHTTVPCVNSQEKVASSGYYEAVWYEMDKSDFSLIFVFDVLEKYRNMTVWIILLFCIIFSILFAGLFLLAFVQRKLTQPVRAFLDNLDMEQISSPAGLHFAELDEINHMFQNAREQIRALKIRTYEQELESCQLEMEYLQVQIKPHFYINCMTIIYNMAQSGHMKEIQQLALETSDYLRSIFRHGNVPVTLAEEMLHVQKYLNINSIRYEDSFTYRVDLPKSLENYRILPLMLHTIIENSIKHGLGSTDDLKIRISACVEKLPENGTAVLHLSVTDNGSGYPEEMLAKLNSDADCRTASGRHIGLYNLKKRIEYFYPEGAGIHFGNLPDGGAATDIYIPVRYVLPEADSVTDSVKGVELT